MGGYARILMKTPVRIAVILAGFALIGGGIYGTFQVKENFESKSTVRDDAYVVIFQNHLVDHYPIGFDVSVINDDVTFDYANSTRQQDFMRLDAICRNNPYMQNRTINWLSAYMSSPYFTAPTSSIVSKNASVSLIFYTGLKVFLQKNQMYNVDLVFDSNTGRIKYSRIVCEDLDISDWKFRANSMAHIRKTVESESSRLPGAFPINLDFFYRDMIEFVKPETIKNLLFSGLAILIITTPYLVHPLVVLLVFSGFVALVFELFALMAAWGVALNTISMITLIMAMGFAVDYSAHVAHAYLLSNRETPEERMIETLSSVGASVLMGGE